MARGPRAFAAEPAFRRIPLAGPAGQSPFQQEVIEQLGGQSIEALIQVAFEAGDVVSLLQANLAVAMQNRDLLSLLLTELREQVQQGIIVAVPFNVTQAQGVVPLTFDPPLFAIGLTNDGPNNVQYRIPNRGDADWINLIPTEVDQFTVIKAKFTSAGFRVQVAGGNATVRMKALR